MNVKRRSLKSKIEYDTSFDYWNNEELEKEKKVFYDVVTLQNSVEQQFFIQELSSYLSDSDEEINSFLSVCCGNLWIETNALKEKNIVKVVGIDYSQHRIHKLALKSIEYTKNNSNIELICGNVLDYNPDEKFDFIYLSKAFHHIESPIILLRKLKNLLSSPPFGIEIWFDIPKRESFFSSSKRNSSDTTSSSDSISSLLSTFNALSKTCLTISPNFSEVIESMLPSQARPISILKIVDCEKNYLCFAS